MWNPPSVNQLAIPEEYLRKMTDFNFLEMTYKHIDQEFCCVCIHKYQKLTNPICPKRHLSFYASMEKPEFICENFEVAIKDK